MKRMLKIGGEPLVKQGFAEAETHIRETMKNVRKMRFREDGKRVAKYLVKPVEFIEIWSQNAEKVRMIVENPLVKQCFAEGKTHIRETMKNARGNKVLRPRKKCHKIPYKTCGIH